MAPKPSSLSSPAAASPTPCRSPDVSPKARPGVWQLSWARRKGQKEPVGTSAASRSPPASSLRLESSGMVARGGGLAAFPFGASRFCHQGGSAQR